MKAILNDDGLAALQRIGEGLDARRPVRVQNNGIVMLDPEHASPAVQEKCYEQGQGTRRSAARSRQRPPGRKGSTSGSRSPRTRPRISSLSASYQQQLEDVQAAYPGAQLKLDQHGVWLSAQSQILSDLGQEAIFLIALPDTPDVEPRGWAYWNQGGKVKWVGDRHTNFFDGSVCAYSIVKDRAWSPGDDLRTLLDLYSVWALRHLHLELIGRWPGRQHALLDHEGRPVPYYRLVEFQDAELCSCDSGARYGACCKTLDLKHNFWDAMQHFKALHQGRGIRDRRPPNLVTRHMANGAVVPDLCDVHELLRLHLSAHA